MTAPREQAEDGQLQPALNALDDAIWALTDPQRQYIDGTLHTGPSWYMQLWDAVSGESTNGGGGGSGSKSQIPFWLDAFQILDEIDTALAVWQPAFTGVPATVGRLKCLRARSWRPQDCKQIEQITTNLLEWVAAIEGLLNPKPRWSLPYPCPNCGADKVYKPDSTGTPVRQYALALSPEGCTCGACKAHWPQGRFLFLGRLLNTVHDSVGE
jgi:hypothetical protein